MVDLLELKRNLGSAKKELDSLLLKKRVCEETLLAARNELADKRKYLLNAEKGRAIVQTVAAQLQRTLEFRISSIVSMALAAVFPDPYEFKVQFVDRRNQTECDMFFMRDGNECEVDGSASGGGALDIASIALRMAIWSIKKTRAIQILDEPSRNLSRDMQAKCSELLKLLSEELDMQMIIVSHIPELLEYADRIFDVENENGYSSIKMIG